MELSGQNDVYVRVHAIGPHRNGIKLNKKVAKPIVPQRTTTIKEGGEAPQWGTGGSGESLNLRMAEVPPPVNMYTK